MQHVQYKEASVANLKLTMKKLKLTIQGMHCASCASNVERSIRSIKGVKSASISAITHKGVIETDDSVSNEELSKAVARAGYKLVKVE